MIFDSDVLIWLLRESDAAADIVDETEDLAVSVIAYMEILRGAVDKRNLAKIKDMFEAYAFAILPLTPEIGDRATRYVEEHALSVRMDVTDALIAATAVEHGLPLCTANAKHYHTIKELDLVSFRP